MDQTSGSALPGTPIPPSFTFSSSSFRRSYTETPSSSSSAPSHEPPSGVRLGDDFEKQRHLRQNQEIIRLCALKSIQIRQSEAKLSELESENLDLRTALRHAKRKLDADINTPQSLPPRRYGREGPTAEVESGTYSGPYLAKQDRAVSPDRRSGIGSRHEEEFDQEPEFPDHYGHGFKRHRTRSPESSFSSMQLLLSKLDQIQTIFQSEHEAICSMMRSFNSTTRLYKNIIHLLENEALKSHDNGCQGSHGDRASDVQLSIPSLNSWSQYSRTAWTSSESESPERSGGTSSNTHNFLESLYPSRAAPPYSFIASTRSSENTTHPPTDSQSGFPPTSPKTRTGIYSGLSSILQYGDRPQRSTAERDQILKDSDTAIDLNMKDPDPPEIARAIRPAIRDLSKATTLPPIDEDCTDALFSPRRERDLSLIGLVGTRTSPLREQESTLLVEPRNPQSENRPIVDRVGRSYIPETSDMSSALQTTRETQPVPSNNHQIAFGVKPGEVINERSKSLILSKVLLEKYKTNESTQALGSRSVPPEATTSRSPDALETILAEGGDKDGSDRQGNDITNSYEGIATNSSASVNNTTTTSSNTKRKRTTATRSERTTPSPMIKSRTAINSQYLRSKPQQLHPRTSKSLLDEDDPSMPPLSVVQNSAPILQKYGIPIKPTSSVARPPSTNTAPKSTVASLAQVPAQGQPNTVVKVHLSSSSSKANDDSAILMPPPAPSVSSVSSASNPPQIRKQHRAKRAIGTDGSQLQSKSNQSGIAPVTKSGEAEDVHENRTITENTQDSTIVPPSGSGKREADEAAGSRFRKRAAKAPVLYRLPSLTRYMDVSCAS